MAIRGSQSLFASLGGAAFAVPVLAVLLTGCAGGGGPTAPAVTVSETDVELESFQLINDARRANGGLGDLALDVGLSAVAREHSRDMRDHGYFSHVDAAGHDFDGRLQIAGVRFTTAGENIARVTNSPDPAELAHELFLGNPEHRANMLNTAFTRVGVGVSRQGNTFWITQLYIRP